MAGPARRGPSAGASRTAQAWLDGRLVASEALPDADPRAPSCYTTGRYAAGRVHLGTLVAARLARDARRLGLGGLAPEACLAALVELGRAVFGEGAGVVRLEARPGEGGAPRLVGTTRPLGPEPATWRAVTGATAHPGPDAAPGAKRLRPALAEARRALAARGDAEEALLFDAGGHLVEGTRASLVVVGAGGAVLTPAAALGGVASVALEALRARGAPLQEARLARDAVAGARELVALNAVRGACPVVTLDGAPVGDGAPGPVAARLAALLAEAE